MAASGQNVFSFSGKLSRLRKDGDGAVSGVQSPQDDLGTLGDEDSRGRFIEMEQLWLRQPRIMSNSGAERSVMVISLGIWDSFMAMVFRQLF